MAERKAVTAATRSRYQRASKKEKGKILAEFVELTGYHRVYARSVLRTGERKLVREPPTAAESKSATEKSRKVYDQQVLIILRQIWMILDYICGKRLVAIMPEVIRRLEYFGELKVEPEVRAKLLRISAATIDRLLRTERRKHELRGRGGTKPGTLLKKQIPLRTFSEWNEQRPGFVEIDLVGHDGGLLQGEYLQTLDMTDIYSGWTEVQAVQNKAQVWVFAALKESCGSGCLFLCAGSTRTTVRSLSMLTCCSTVNSSGLPLPGRGPTARTTTAMSSRRTTPWYGGMLATSVWLGRNNWLWSTNSMSICASTRITFNR